MRPNLSYIRDRIAYEFVGGGGQSRDFYTDLMILEGDEKAALQLALETIRGADLTELGDLLAMCDVAVAILNNEL